MYKRDCFELRAYLDSEVTASETSNRRPDNRSRSPKFVCASVAATSTAAENADASTLTSVRHSWAMPRWNNPLSLTMATQPLANPHNVVLNTPKVEIPTT